LPSAQGEPGIRADGRESDVPHAHHAARFDADADDVAAPHGGPMTPFETGDPLDAAAIVAPSSYSPLDADVNDAPELPRTAQLARRPHATDG
jgi:hypothetical protein